MEAQLLSHILDGDVQAVANTLATLPAKELKRLRKEIPGLIEEHVRREVEGDTYEERSAFLQKHAMRRDLFHLAGLFGATKRQLRGEVDWLSSGSSEWMGSIEDAIIEVIRAREWPAASHLI